MEDLSKKNKNKVWLFPVIAILVFFSFFDEARISWLSNIALLSIGLLPLIILFQVISANILLTKSDGKIIVAFLVWMVLQCLCMRWDNFYSSVTPVYRSFTSLTVIVYVRKYTWNTWDLDVIVGVTVITFLLGMATIFSPLSDGSNKLFGNYNTVGVLYFTLGVINLLIYLHQRRGIFLFLCALCLLMIVISKTRTALFLLLFLILGWLLLNVLPQKIVQPKVVLPIGIAVIVGFVWFYYNIKSLSIYQTLNRISQELFHKNFDSGRPDLWHMTVEAVGEKWFLGRGTGIDLEEFYSYVKTPHSVYFDIYLQNGIAGVISLCICILFVVSNKGKWCKTKFNTCLLILATVIIFYNAVGIVFTKARSGIGLLQWMLLAFPYQQNGDAKKREGGLHGQSCRAGV